MTTRPPTIGDRPQGEVFAGRPIPDRRPEDAGVEHGWVWEDTTGQIVAYEGVNPSDDDITVTFQIGALQERFTIPAGTTERLRHDLPPSRRLACRRATIADHPWQRRAGWVVPGVSSIHTERTYGKPTRNSPSVASAAVTEFFAGATTTHNVPMPATVNAGDGLIVMWFHDNASLTQASGFAPLGTATLTDRCYIFGRVAVGNEDSANVNFQALTASFALAHTYRITAGTWAGTLSGIHVTGATGNTATPNPPNNAPLWGSNDALWLVFAGKTGSSGQTITGAPTNYTNFTADSSDLSGSARRSTTAASEDPGTFSGTGTDNWMAFTIAVASDTADFGDIPVFVGVGNTAQGTAGVTAELPGGIVTGDKLLLHIQGEGEDANADPANADWTLVDTQASATGGAAGDTRLTVYEVDYDSSDPPDLSIGDAGDHIICFITAWRDPNGGTLTVHQVQGTTDATADTSLSATGVTTTVDNCLIVVSVGLGDDSGVLAWTNASLAAPEITPAGSDRTTQGSDGSLGVAFGGLAGQGASGTTTGTLATSEEEANIVIALAPAAGGTTFQESMAGTITPAAALTRETATRKTGSTSPAGTTRRETSTTKAGTASPTGALAKRSPRTYAGTTTPAGAATRETGKQLAGTTTPAGSEQHNPSITRGGTITPAGTVVRSAAAHRTGATTPAGALTRAAAKTLAGTITPAGSLTTALKRLISLAGTITPAGVLRRLTATRKTGGATPEGATTRETRHNLEADLATSGTLLREVATTTTGDLTPAGELTRETAKTTTGTSTPSGSLTRKTLKTLTGAIASAGTVALQQIGGLVQRLFTGALSPTGALRRATATTRTGTTTPTGHYGPATTRKQAAGSTAPAGAVTLSRRFYRALSGAISTSGQLTRTTKAAYQATVTPAGAVARYTARRLAGAIAPEGGLIRRIAKRLASSLGLAGSLTTSYNPPTAPPIGIRIRHQARTTTPNVPGAGAPPGILGAGTTPTISHQDSEDPTV